MVSMPLSPLLMSELSSHVNTTRAIALDTLKVFDKVTKCGIVLLPKLSSYDIFRSLSYQVDQL